MNQYAVIVAGGTGTRMGGDIPKQFQTLCGRPILWWSMKAFHDENPLSRLILVVHEDFIPLWNDIFYSLPRREQFHHQIISGGISRSESVKKGLSLIDDGNSLVAVHDGARPLVAPLIIAKGWEMARKHDAAIPVVPVTDSLRKISSEGSHAVDRSEYVAVQTPQVFKTSVLKDAYGAANGKSFSDDAAIAENAGFKVSLFEGSHINIKITNPKDLEIAEVLMKDV